MYDELDEDILAKAERECLTRPSNSAMWDDRLYTTHGPVLSWAERGDDVLAESNYLRVSEDLLALAGEDSEDVIDATISDWLVGSLRQLFVRVRDEETGDYTPAFREAVSISLALRDYPVYDESDYSEREWEAAEESLDMALDDGQRAYEREWDCDLSDEEDAAVREAVRMGETVQNCFPEVLWDDIVREYAEHAQRLSEAGWESYARSLVPTQEETLI